MALRHLLTKLLRPSYLELPDCSSLSSSSSSTRTTSTERSKKSSKSSRSNTCTCTCAKHSEKPWKKSGTQFGFSKNWQEPSLLDAFLTEKTVKQMDLRLKQKRQLERDRAFMLGKLGEMEERLGKEKNE